MTDERTPEEELELDGEDQDSGHDGMAAADQVEDEDLDDAQEGAGDDQEDLDDEEVEKAPRSSATLPQVRGRTPAAPVAPKTSVAHSEDELPYIDDRASKIWVGAIVAVFALILAYGLLFGKSGALTPPTPSPTPSPVPTATASASPAPSASVTPVPSITPVPSVTPAPSATATPAASPTACTTPTPAATGAQPSPGC